MTNPIAQYTELENRLAALIPKVKFSKDINLKLERIEHLLKLLGDPQAQFATIHVGGTNGKGSTSTTIASLLIEAGYSTGLHVSPHLQLLNERHQVNGWVAPTSKLLALLDGMMPAIEQTGEDLSFGLPSYFEVQFALSMMYFASENVDVAVVEVGLGGTRDATNVVPSSVAVLTSVGLDHTEILGDTIEKIITDKAGIIKPQQKVVTGVTQPSALEIIEARCKLHGASLQVVSEADFERLAEWDVELKGFQRWNARVAVAAVEQFLGRGLSAETITTALQNIRYPGRLEQMQSEPTVILDGAHNPDKMRAASAALPKGFDRTVAVIAMKAGKDVTETLQSAIPLIDELVATEFRLKGLWEPVSAEIIAATALKINPELKITIVSEPLEAVEKALSLAQPNDLVWVTGSFYLLGNARQFWYSNDELVVSAETGLRGSLSFD